MLKVVILADSLKNAEKGLFTLVKDELAKLTNTMYIQKNDGTRYILVYPEDNRTFDGRSDIDQIFIIGEVPRVTRYLLNNALQNSCVPKEFKVQHVSI